MGRKVLTFMLTRTDIEAFVTTDMEIRSLKEMLEDARQDLDLLNRLFPDGLDPSRTASIESFIKYISAEVDQLAQRNIAVMDAVMHLPEPYRTAFFIKYIDGRTIADVSAEFGFSPTSNSTWRRITKGFEILIADGLVSASGRPA